MSENKEDINQSSIVINSNSPSNKNILLTSIKVKQKNLNEKLEKMKIPQNILSGVKSSIAQSDSKIKAEIESEKIKISKTKSNLKNLIPTSKNSDNSIYEKLSEEDKKLIKHLESEKSNLNSLITKTKEMLKNLNSESFKGAQNNVIEENKRKAEIKALKIKKEELEQKFNIISFHLKDLISFPQNKNESIKNFLLNFDKNKEKIKIKLKQLQNENFKYKKTMEKDLKKSIQKKTKILDEEEKAENQNKIKLKENLKENVKNFENKRKKIISDISLKSKPFRSAKPTKLLKDFFFYKNNQKFENQENKLLNKVKMTKKEKLITKEELQEVSKKLNQLKLKTEEDKIKSKKILNEIWKNRSLSIPEYKGPFYNDIDNSKDLNDLLVDNKHKIESLINEKIKYSKENVPKQKINLKLKEFREKLFKKDTKDAILLLQQKNKKKTLLFKVPSPIKKKHNNIEHKILFSECDSKIVPYKKVKLSPINPNKINYLDELKNHSSNNKRRFYINNSFNNIKSDDSVDVLKYQTDSLDEQIQRQKQLIKYNGGYMKNPEMNCNISNLLLDSIKTKLKILDTLSD